MKITAVELKSFKSYVTTTIDTDSRRVLLAGQNGAGKSTLLRDAVLWVLIGETPDVSGKGSGGELLAPDFLTGLAEVSAAVVLEDGLRVERRWTPAIGQNLNVAGWTGNLAEQQAGLFEKLHASAGLLRMLVDARAFLRLDHADAKRLLLDVLNVQIPITVGEETTTYTLETLEAAYQKAFTERRDAKARLKAVIVPPSPRSETVYKPLDQYAMRMKEVRGELGTAQQAIGETVGIRATLTKQIAEASRQLIEPKWTLESIDEDIRLAHLELAAIPAPAPHQELQPVWTDPVAERLTFLTGRIQALAAHHPSRGCVIDQAVPCKTPPNAFSKQTITYQAEYNGTKPPKPQPKAPPADPTADPAALQQEITVLRDRRAQIERGMLRNTELTAQIKGWQSEVEALPDTSEQEAVIATIQATIAKGEKIIADATALQQATQRHQAGLQERTAAEAEVARLEDLVAVLGPSGARVDALQTAFAGFETTINPYLAPFGWTVHLEAEPWQVRVNRRLVQTYSASERYRIGVALQLALAQMSGVSFCVVDELDVLDNATREVVGRMLYQSAVGQILVLGTRDPKSALPSLPETKCYRVGQTAGRSAILEQTPA